MEELLTELFDETVTIFFAREAQNILDDVAERNLCGRLAIYLTTKLQEYKLMGYYADPEYNRKQGGKIKTILDSEMNEITIQSDLIVHSRGEIIGMDNLITIEMKKSTRPEAERVADRIRLRAMTQDSYDGVWSNDGVTLPEHVCGYFVGVYMILNLASRSCFFEYYEHGQLVGERVQTF
ncbi:MAG: hypothetical protein LWW85_02140 [Marinilabiliales bacterium]|nr:hypothetical protein [Marinilabiliales bacterium]